MATSFDIESYWDEFVSQLLDRRFWWSEYYSILEEHMIYITVKKGNYESWESDINENFDKYFMEAVNNVHNDIPINDLTTEQQEIKNKIMGEYYNFDTDDFFSVINEHLKDKIKTANLGHTLDKLYNLTTRLWNEHKIILLNNTSCCGTCSWGEIERTYKDHESDGVLGVIGWWDQNDLLPAKDKCVIGIWNDNKDIDNDIEVKRINLKNLSKYVVPILADLDIDYKINQHAPGIKWLYLNLGEFIMPTNLCPKCFEQ
jgi:hypothetical protein